MAISGTEARRGRSAGVAKRAHVCWIGILRGDAPFAKLVGVQVHRGLGSQLGDRDHREVEGVMEAIGWVLHFVAEPELGDGGLVKSLDLMGRTMDRLTRYVLMNKFSHGGLCIETAALGTRITLTLKFAAKEPSLL